MKYKPVSRYKGLVSKSQKSFSSIKECMEYMDSYDAHYEATGLGMSNFWSSIQAFDLNNDYYISIPDARRIIKLNQL